MATGEGMNPGNQFLQFKGFGQIVIGTGIQGLNTLIGPQPRRQYQYREINLVAPPAVQQVQAILIRQA